MERMMQNTIEKNGCLDFSAIHSADSSSTVKKLSGHKKLLNNILNKAVSIYEVICKALKMLQDSIHDWRKSLNISESKGMGMSLEKAYDNNKMQKEANLQERDAAYTASWGDFAKGVASVAAGALGGTGLYKGTDAWKMGAQAASSLISGAADFTKVGVTQASANETREAKDTRSDAELQNKILSVIDKQVSQVGQKAATLQSQMSSVNDELRQLTTRLYVPLSQG